MLDDADKAEWKMGLLGHPEAPLEENSEGAAEAMALLVRAALRAAPNPARKNLLVAKLLEIEACDLDPSVWLNQTVQLATQGGGKLNRKERDAYRLLMKRFRG
jgi:hypothetical protein